MLHEGHNKGGAIDIDDQVDGGGHRKQVAAARARKSGAAARMSKPA